MDLRCGLRLYLVLSFERFCITIKCIIFSITGINTELPTMTITKRLGITLTPLRLHAASTVRIPHSTNNFQNLLPTVRVTPLNLFSASTVNLHGASNSNMFRNNLQIRLNHLNHQFYVNILIRSRDLECTLVFLSAMPRSATVAIIYALRLLSLHL